MSDPLLRLVWVNVAMAAAKDRSKSPNPPSPPSKLARCWETINTNGAGITVILALLAIAGNAVWNVSTTYNRLGNLEEAINGKGGLKEQMAGLSQKVVDLNTGVSNLNTKVEAIDKYVLSPLRPKAAKLLGTDNVNIFRSDFLPISTTSPFRPIKSAGKNYTILFEFEPIKDGALPITVRIIASDGKKTELVDSRQVQLNIPQEIEKPETFYLRIESKEGLVPAIKLSIVVMERLAPNKLILASGFVPEGNQISSTISSTLHT